MLGAGRKRLRSNEVEDGNANKKGRIHEEEAGEKEKNQDSEVTEEKKTEELDEGEGEEEETAEDDENGNEGSGNNVNRENSERNGSGNQESGGNEDGENDENQESGGDEDGENDENQEDDNNEEERRRRAAEKGKQPISLGFGDLKSMWNFKNMNDNIPNTPSDKLLKHILFSNPNFKLPKDYLKMKIIEFHSNFEDVIQMDGPNPEMTRTIAREAFYLCKLLWGSQQQQQLRLHRVQQQRLQWVQRVNQQQQ
ncbi:hypothetical protein KY290_025079 [Solanum tuberosum]|uniref:Uncharacterized protein n=1 Tax=Solanum tuberosum TaxID=4113 RepID=A0ABQ7UUC6_SOLTU|nr:hypothetical protein KY284_023929 [Solanum tuberosum]KAH0754809.1 hypothetical protein KY290_025079 [Solanum tuberosum]